MLPLWDSSVFLSDNCWIKSELLVGVAHFGSVLKTSLRTYRSILGAVGRKVMHENSQKIVYLPCHAVVSGRIVSLLNWGSNWESADAELMCPPPWAMQWATSSDRIFLTVCSVSHLRRDVLKLPLKCAQVLLAISKQRLKLTATLHVWNGHQLPLCEGEKVHPGGWHQPLGQQQNWSEPLSLLTVGCLLSP